MKESVPLSSAQYGIWYMEHMRPEAAIFNMPLVLLLEGRIHRDILEEALNIVIENQDVLRTSFHITHEHPVQSIHQHRPIQMQYKSMLNDPMDSVLEELRMEAAVAFDLENDPLIRMFLYNIELHTHVLLLVVHHIVSDGWSNNLLMSQLFQIYDELAANRPVPELLPQIQFAEYNMSAEGYTQEQMNYWLNKLHYHDDVVPKRLYSYIRREEYSSRGEFVSFQLNQQMVNQLTAFSISSGGTLFVTLLSAFIILLWLHSGNNEFLVGTPVANRDDPAIGETIGCFVNTIVLRNKIDGNMAFTELFKAVRNEFIQSLMNQNVPFEKVVENLETLRRRPNVHPVYQILFALQNQPQSLKSEQVNIDRLGLNLQRVKYDLHVNLELIPSGIDGWFSYDPGLFSSEKMEQICSDYQRILETLLDTTQIPLQDIFKTMPWCEETGSCEAEEDNGFIESFQRQVEINQSNIALVFKEQKFSYATLNIQSDRIVSHMKRLLDRNTPLVGFCLDQGPDVVFTMLALMKMRVGYSAIDPMLPDNRLLEICYDANLRILITQKKYKTRFEVLASAIDIVYLEDIKGENGEINGNQAIKNYNPKLAYVMYTSGTSGSPKGVMIGYKQLNNYIKAIIERFRLKEDNQFALVSGFYSDLGYTMIFPALATGGCLHITPKETVLDPHLFASFIQAQKIDVYKIVPSHFRALNDRQINVDLLPRKAIIFGGEALEWSIVDNIQKASSDCRIYNHYGPTETTVGALTYCVGQERLGRSVPIGFPLQGVEPRLEPDNEGVLRLENEGELYLSGVQIADGYLNNRALTNQYFHQSSSGRYYKTGDRVRLHPGGAMEYLGRLDNQVKVRGYRVELDEVDRAINLHKHVQLSAVFFMQGNLVAFVQHNKNTELTEFILKTYLENMLPEYMIPSRVYFLDSMPLNRAGKIDRSALREKLASEKCEVEITGNIDCSVVESQLIEIWESLLNRKVLSEDDFFQIGGHSLQAIMLILRIKDTFDIELSLQEFLSGPQIKKLANLIQSKLEAKEEDHDENVDLQQFIDGLTDDEIETMLAKLRKKEKI